VGWFKCEIQSRRFLFGERELRTMRTNVLQWVLATVLLVAVGWWVRGGPWRPSRIVGAAMLLVAFGLGSAARYQLGSAFSLTAKAQRLVTTGLYARIRNPIYVFATLALAGFALLVGSWWPVVAIAVLTPVQMMRARKESAVLEAAFGEEYRRYRKRTWF
jgi:protein-S-isoprenylcysteine O-methyltransferase Ste14